MPLSLNFVAISGVLIGASSLFMSSLMFAVGRDYKNRLWGIFCLAVFIWGTSFYFVATRVTPDAAYTWWRISHVGVTLIPILFVTFVFAFLEELDTRHKIILGVLYAIAAFYLWADIFTNFLLGGVYLTFGQFYYDFAGPLYLSYFIWFQALIIYGHVLLLLAYLRSKDQIQRAQIRYFFIATVVGFLGGGISFSPVFRIDIYPASIITVSLYPIIVGYAMLKYNLFNLKVVTAQIAALLIFIFTFLRFFTSTSVSDYLLNAGLLIIALILSGYLIRSVLKEVEARETIEKERTQLAVVNKQLDKSNSDLKDLSEHLQQKVDEQTKEIRQAYEVEKKARIELEQLDKNKNQFILATQHHLRTPLTIVKGYIESLLATPDDKIAEQAKPVLERADVAADRLSSLVNDLLDISQMQVGKDILKKEEVDIKPLVDEIVNEMQEEIDKKSISKEMSVQDVKLKLDKTRIKEALSNLVDNAVKYSNQGGKITIKGELIDKTYHLTFQDTGIGLTQPELERAFLQYFERGEEAEKINKTGRGIGLAVTKNIIEAHGGKVAVESEGRNKGAKFTIELPWES